MDLIDVTDADAVASALMIVFLYCAWLRFLVGVHENRLDRRDYYDPPTGRPWVRPRPRYDRDLSH